MAKSNLLAKSQDLLKALDLDLQVRNGQCVITIQNSCPPDWKVIILVAGVKFFYVDGTDFIDGPRQVMLTSGQAALFRSNKPDGCVQSIFCALKVKAGDEEPATFTYDDAVEPGKCLLRMTVSLGPKNQIEQKDLASDSIAPRLEVRRIA